MELSSELIPLNLKQIDVEIIDLQDEFDTTLCGSSVNANCRVCLEKFPLNKMCNIFDPIKLVNICDMIMSCASVQIMKGDGLPTMVCHKCMAKLNTAWEFKLLCEESDAKLRQLSSDPLSIQATADLDSFTLVLRQQEENNEKSEIYEQSLHLSEFIEDDSDSIKREHQERSDSAVDNKSRSSKKTAKTKDAQISILKKAKIHQCDTCGKAYHRREYLTRHIRTHTGEKPYRCHLCDKRFMNTGHLSTHMRTHTGERPHACTLCPKAFCTKQELRKHTMVHNGERPFACKLCDKRFGSSSNLYSHLKHHTGEKNFTCEHCGKAFYTKQELKQHSVVHTGERTFLCQFCNKRFAQLAHLRRHFKTHKSLQL